MGTCKRAYVFRRGDGLCVACRFGEDDPVKDARPCGRIVHQLAPRGGVAIERGEAVREQPQGGEHRGVTRHEVDPRQPARAAR